MKKNRVEAFSDGVIAIVITIMVLALKVPDGVEFKDLIPMLPVFASYVLSFIYIGIYWNNHHHLFQAVDHIGGYVLWANLHWLFWLSLLPFVTAWMGENGFASQTVALYGMVLLAIALAYALLTRALIARHGKSSVLAKSIGKDTKSKVSILFYVIAIGFAFYFPMISCTLYAIVAAGWFIPDRRIETEIDDT